MLSNQPMYTGMIPVQPAPGSGNTPAEQPGDAAHPDAAKPRMFTGRTSLPAPRTESIQRLYSVPEYMRVAAQHWSRAENQADQSVRSARLAASVIFVRDGDNGLETILTYRPGCSPLGIVAFPGGAVREDDSHPLPWHGPSPEAWRKKLHFDSVDSARASVIAAIRESFEETGILLAGSDSQSVAEYSAGDEHMCQRSAVALEDRSFNEFLRLTGLQARTDLLRAVDRWQSPDFFHKRFDTSYFTAAIPVGQRAKLLREKGVWGDWVNVRQLLAERNTTALGDAIGQENTVGKKLEELIAPGVMCMLESLAKADSAVAWLAKSRNVRVQKPTLVSSGSSCMLSFMDVVPVAPKTGRFGAVPTAEKPADKAVEGTFTGALKTISPTTTWAA